MVNTAVVPHTDVFNDCASVTSDNTPSCACSASGHCSAATSAGGPDTAFTLRQQLDGINSQFADVFAEPSELPPDRGTQHVIPLEQPPCKRMYCMSPSELVWVKRHATELLQKQLIVPSVNHTEPVIVDHRALNKLTKKLIRFHNPKLMGCLTNCRDHTSSLALMLPLAFTRSYFKRQTRDCYQNPTWPLPVQGIALWPHQCTSHIPSHHEQGAQASQLPD